MRRSFIRLTISSVLLSWALGLAVVFVFMRRQVWTEDKAQRAGVFLVQQLLDTEPAPRRAARLAELQPHCWVDLALVPIDEVERRVGHAVEAGARVPHRPSGRAHWYYAVFSDGRGALAAGPVHPAIPPDTVPIGALVAVLGIPLIAGLLALRVERELAKVERASDALAEGELSARVDNPSGPSTELAARFNAMADRLERAIRSRDELVQAISHELGSPLSRLRFHLELLAPPAGALGDERREAMARELDALDALVAELLGYVQSDEVELKVRRFEPQDGLSDLAELARLDAPEDRAVDLAVPDGVHVIADERLFQRAVENILRNAVRYAKSRVRLELTQHDTEVRVAVHDDGPGIPEAMREKVKVPFFRLDANRGRKTGGVGLGLAIVCRIVERHGGRLEIGTSPLGGALVTTRWPRDHEPPPA